MSPRHPVDRSHPVMSDPAFEPVKRILLDSFSGMFTAHTVEAIIRAVRETDTEDEG